VRHGADVPAALAGVLGVPAADIRLSDVQIFLTVTRYGRLGLKRDIAGPPQNELL
jgi:hypothetical protein